MRPRHRLALTPFVLGVMSGCSSAPGALNAPLLQTTAPGAAATISQTTGSVVTNNGGGLISNNAGSLTGTVLGPAAGLITNNAGNLLANNGSSLLSNNASSLISTHAAEYVTLAYDAGLLQPIAQAQVAAYDEAGNQLSAPVSSDAAGRYTLTLTSPAAGPISVRAVYQAEGHAVSLESFSAAPSGSQPTSVRIDPATTLVAKKVDALLQAHQLQPSAIQPATLAQMAAQIAQTMTARTVTAAAVLDAGTAAGVFDQMAAASPTLETELESATAGTPASPATGVGAVDTLAGGLAGDHDGRGPSAAFNYPYAIAATAQGTLYVADYQNQCIRKLGADGTVTTFAGSGATGAADGSAARASFNGPRGLALDATGTLYVADTGNNRIRTISADGTVATLAGDGTAGCLDGAGTRAELNAPRGLALDAQGNLIVADTGNACIRKITPQGDVSTLAVLNTATAIDDQLKGPYAVAVGPSGQIYVADAGDDAIALLHADGTLTAIAGSQASGFSDGSGTAARFHGPVGLTIAPSGNLYVADLLNCAIREVTPQGAVTTLAGTGKPGSADGVGTQAGFFGPYGLSWSADDHLYVADTSNQRIRRIALH